MSYTKKSLDEMDILDDFLMNAVATDAEVGEEFCRTLLSTLLQKKLGKVRVIGQRTIAALDPEQRGIRMDVEVEELDEAEAELPTMNIYDLEPHQYASDRKQLTRRSRFYQAKIDSTGMKAGDEDFANLPNLYVINVLNYDPFGYDYMLYTIQNKCTEVDELDYEDGLQFLYFYTEGKKGGNEAIAKMLQFIQNSQEEMAGDSETRKLLDYVKRVKVKPEVRRSYMRVDEIMRHVRAEGVEEGREEGREEVLIIQITKKLAKGKTAAQISEELEIEQAEVERLMAKQE